MSPKLALKILSGAAVFIIISFVFLYFNSAGFPGSREQGSDPPAPDNGRQQEAEPVGEDEKESVDPEKEIEDKSKEMMEKDFQEEGEVQQDTRSEIQDMVNEQNKQEKLDGTTTQEEKEQEERQKERREIMEEVNE